MYKCRKNGIYFAILLSLAALCALSLAFSLPIAYAEAGADSYEVVFPTADYFQSQDPTAVAANENFLVVYDAQQSRLYVRKNGALTYFFDISAIFEDEPAQGAEELPSPGDESSPERKTQLSDVYVVGSHAFVVTSRESEDPSSAPTLKLWSLDLADRASELSPCAISAPARIYCFASDGERLYAKNAAGEIVIYDEQLQVVRDGISNDALAGKASMAGFGDDIYLFATEQSVPHLYIYDAATDSLKLNRQSKLVRTAYIGDVIFAQLSPAEEIENHSKIICLDKETGEELYASNFMPESFCAYGDRLYSINDGSVTGYRFKQLAGGEYTLEPEETISMAGGDERHLNRPTDVIVQDGKLIIADSENARLAVVDMAGGATSLSQFHSQTNPDVKPLRLAGGDGNVYALYENSAVVCYALEDGALIEKFALNADAEGELYEFEDILYFGGKLYGMTKTELYVYVAGNFILAAQFDGARRLAAAKGGNSIYVLTDGEIFAYNSGGERMPTKLTGDFSQALDLAADYEGNIFLLNKDSVTHLKNRVSSLQKLEEIELTSQTYAASATSCFLDGDDMYFSAEECFVGRLAVNATNGDDFAAPALPSPDENTTYYFAKPKDDATPYFIPAEDLRADKAIPATDNVLLVLDDLGELEDGLAYALDGDKLYVIETSSYEAVDPVAADGKSYLFTKDSRIYFIPYFEALGSDVTTGTQGATMISDCAGYDGNVWRIIKFEGKYYFADPDALEEDLAPPPPVDPDDPDPQKPEQQDETLFGRAKANRVGGTVNIYSDMSESKVLASIVDGKKVRVLASYNSYYQVQYGDLIGYMRADDVKLGGLTTVQIVAIVLSALVLVAGTGIFVSIYQIKKRSDAEAEASNA